MAKEQKYRVVLSELPPVGAVIEEGGQRYEVAAARPHKTRDGRDSGVILWRSACRACGAPIEQETGFLVRALNRNCSEHGFWSKTRGENLAKVTGPGPNFVAGVKAEAPSRVSVAGWRGLWMDVTMDGRDGKESYHPDVASHVVRKLGLTAAEAVELATAYECGPVQAEDLF